MAPWAWRNCFRRRMIVEDIRFRIWLDIALLKILGGLFFLWWKSLHVHGKIELNCAKCNGLQILLNFLNINLEKVLHSSSVHSSLVHYLTQVSHGLPNKSPCISLEKTVPPLLIAFFQLVWAVLELEIWKPVKKFYGRILDLAWLKFAVAALYHLGWIHRLPGSCVVLQTGAWEGLKT